MSKNNCPICDQYMDLICLSHKNKPFVDGKCYPQMCFGCYHTPKIEIVEYDEKDNIAKVEEVYGHAHLKTPEELYEDKSTGTLEEARKCVSSVEKSCKSTGLRALKKLKLKRPEPDYIINPEIEIKKPRKKKK